MSKKATQQQLEELHGEFTGILKTYVKKTRKILEAAGDDEQIELNGSVLNVVKGFLKDNGIDGYHNSGKLQPGKGAEEFASLEEQLDALPFQNGPFTTRQ